MSGISGFLSRTLGLGGYHAANVQISEDQTSSSESASPAVPAVQVAEKTSDQSSPSESASPAVPLPAIQVAEEPDSGYEIQVALLTRLKHELLPDGNVQECQAIFNKLRSDVQQWIGQLLGEKPDDQILIPQKNRDALSQKMEDVLLFVKSRVPSLEERTVEVGACFPVSYTVADLISKYAMERFDDEFFGRQQWISCWGAMPVTKQGEEEHSEPSEELHECLNRRVRPQDKLLAGFTSAVTYIPQYVKKDDRILSLTVRTLCFDLGPCPVQGMAAKIVAPEYICDTLLTPEHSDKTEGSCYFVMERDVAPDTRGKEPSVLTAEIEAQGDKGWQLPQSRNFIATVFSRRAWKGEFLYGRNPETFTLVQSLREYYLFYGQFDADHGLFHTWYPDFRNERHGASGSRKFPAKG